MTNTDHIPTWQIATLVATCAGIVLALAVVVLIGFASWVNGPDVDCTSTPYATGCPLHGQVQ